MNKDMERLCETAEEAAFDHISEHLGSDSAEKIVRAVLLELRAGFDAKAKNGNLHDAQVARYAGVAIELILQD